MGLYKIYKITNKINNKIYIGKTTRTIKKRWNIHLKNSKKRINRYLYDSMNKYGSDNFLIEEIDFAINNNDANEKEKFYILKYQSNNKNFGYNMTNGGDGGNTGKYYYGKSPYDWWVEKYGKEKAEKIKKDVYEKISKKLKSYYKNKTWEDRFGNKSEEIKSKISKTLKEKKIKPPINSMKGSKHPMFGKTHSEKAKKKLSEFRKGKSYETLYGKKRANELKNKKRMKWKGSNNPNYLPELNDDEIIKFINFLINGKTMKDCSLFFKKSTYKLRKILKKNNIDNIQKLRNNDQNNIKLNKILKNYEKIKIRNES